MKIKSFPFFRQHDATDCGPACLQMIAAYYGADISLNEIRVKTSNDRGGVSLLSLQSAAEGLGFKAVGVELSFDDLHKEVKLPCIVHWHSNHFVVVTEVRKNKVIVADPGFAIVKYSQSEFVKGWIAVPNGVTGFALLLEPGTSFATVQSGTEKKRIGFADLFRHVRSQKKLIWQILIGLILGVVIQLVLPFVTQAVVDVGIVNGDLGFIQIALIAQLTLLASLACVEFIRKWILLHLSARLNISMLSEFISRLLRLPVSFFSKRTIGDIFVRIEDYSRLEPFFRQSSLSIVYSFLSMLVFGVVLIIYNTEIFFYFFSISCLYVGYTILFLKKRALLEYKRFQLISSSKGRVLELIEGVSEIKVNNCDDKKRWEWERVQVEIYRLNKDSMRIQQYQDVGGFVINELKNVLITYSSAMAVISGEMTLGMMLAVQFIIGQLNGPISDFIFLARDYQDAKISLDRINDVYECPLEFLPELSESRDFSGDITFENVSFSYGPKLSEVIKEVSCIIPTGKTTAVVGASGSGKTTLLKLLLRLYDCDEGMIRIGGRDITQIGVNEWRSLCGAVMQDGFVFSSSIRENVGLSEHGEIDNSKVWNALRIANLTDFVSSLPRGIDTKIGREGIALSQGQVQRILIARAVYRSPHYLFLDEATSALDSTNEKIITDQLKSYFHQKTVVVIAHRLSTVRHADQILVMENGNLVETGNHESLMKKRGAYFRLVQNQLEHASLY